MARRKFHSSYAGRPGDLGWGIRISGSPPWIHDPGGGQNTDRMRRKGGYSLYRSVGEEKIQIGSLRWSRSPTSMTTRRTLRRCSGCCRMQRRQPSRLLQHHSETHPRACAHRHCRAPSLSHGGSGQERLPPSLATIPHPGTLVLHQICGDRNGAEGLIFFAEWTCGCSNRWSRNRPQPPTPLRRRPGRSPLRITVASRLSAVGGPHQGA